MFWLKADRDIVGVPVQIPSPTAPCAVRICIFHEGFSTGTEVHGVCNVNRYLNDNQLTGSIPLELSTLALEELVVHHNYLTGDLMAQLAKLGWSIETLERLDVYPQNLPAYE
mmetsp:Transcript_2223/g.5545  ORF Transcript_2223/g.5545 Transcript_2223/m.5545 type:complete len:112 (-) Transcript_2223:200-535(-)